KVVAGATVELFNCYEIWANDINGVLVYQGFNECYTTSQVSPREVPWHYSLSISIIRRGSTAEELVTSTSGIAGSSVRPSDDVDDSISMTDSDPGQADADFRGPEDRPGYGTVQFLNGKKASRGSPLWLGPAGFPIEEPNILSAPTFDFEVNPGDTVIVR